MRNMIVIKGPSGCGKGTRVAQFIEFLRTKMEPREVSYEHGSKTKLLGLAFDELKLLFIGQYTVSNKSGLASWTSMDTIHGSLGGVTAREFLKDEVDNGFTLVCEGEPLMLSDKWRPAYMFDYYKLDCVSMLYFHYPDRAEYDARIIGRSGKAAGDSAWGRNSEYPKEFEKTLNEMRNIITMAGVEQMNESETGKTHMMCDTPNAWSEFTLMPHDAALACVGRAIMFQLRQKGASQPFIKNTKEFEQFCIDHPMLRSVDGPNPLEHRVPVKAAKAAPVKEEPVPVRTNSILRHFGASK